MECSLSPLEAEYVARVNAMSPKERVARSVAMAKWARDLIARQIRSEDPGVSEERLKWRVALRVYSSDPDTCRLIERMLSDVPD